MATLGNRLGRSPKTIYAKLLAAYRMGLAVKIWTSQLASSMAKPTKPTARPKPAHKPKPKPAPARKPRSDYNCMTSPDILRVDLVTGAVIKPFLWGYADINKEVSRYV